MDQCVLRLMPGSLAKMLEKVVEPAVIAAGFCLPRPAPAITAPGSVEVRCA